MSPLDLLSNFRQRGKITAGGSGGPDFGEQLLGRDPSTFGEGRRALDPVPELARVSRPVMSRCHAQGARRVAGKMAPEGCRKLCTVVLEQRLDVVPPLPQRGNLHLDD